MDNKIQTLVSNTEKINDEVKSLESKVETLAEEKTLLKRRVDKLTEDLDEMEQYSRRSCLIFAGIKETGDIPEDTDKAILDVCNNKLGLNLTQEVIDCSLSAQKSKLQKRKKFFLGRVLSTWRVGGDCPPKKNNYSLPTFPYPSCRHTENGRETLAYANDVAMA